MGKRSVLFLLGLISLSVVANASTRLHAHTHHHTHAANTYNHFVGDFDGDGVSDFLRQKNGGWAGDGKDTAQIFFSSGIGTFKKNTLPSNFDLRGDLTNLYIGDFNGDGKDDILRQEKGSWASDRVNMAYLLLSNSKGSANFEKIVLDESYDLNGELTNLYIGDFNGDGKDDILRQEKGAWATDNVNMAYLLLSQGKSFKKIVLPDNLALNGDYTNLYVGDFNGDKKADVVRQEKGAWAKDNVNMATLLISTGEGFQATTLPSNFDLTGDQTILQVGDFNGDGKDDLLRREYGSWANDRVNTANLLISTGTGFNKIVLSEDFNIPASLTNAYIGDFNGDGKDDFFRQEKGSWANDAVNMADVFLSTGNNFNEIAYPYDKEISGEVSTLLVGDYNGDGYDDFIQNWDLDTYYLHFSQGDGTFF